VPTVAEGRADLGLVADITDLARLQTHLVAQDRLVVVVSQKHRIAQEEAVPFVDVVGEPFVGLADAALEMHLAERASRLGRQIEYRIQIRGIENVGLLVEAGIGIAILSEVSAKTLMRPGLAILTLAEPWATRRLFLCARDFDTLAPQARLLMKALTEDATSG
jgi:DNA-binding transcriptional LysR family regulator